MVKDDPRNGLARRISTFELTAMGVGVILGAGIYVLVGEAAGRAGSAVWISFGLAAVAAVLTGLTYAELASSFPSSAAAFEFTRRAFGARTGFVIGWTMLFAMTIPAAAVALGFAEYLDEFVSLPTRLVAVALIVASALLLIRGVSESVRVGVVFAAVEIGGLILVVVVSTRYLDPGGGDVNYLDLFDGVNGILAATALIFFAFLGFEQIANLGEEARDPKRGLPIAIISAVAITSVVYMLVALSAVSVVNWRELAESGAPLSLVVREATGADLAKTLSVIALFATANTVLFSMLAGSRALFGMARDGSLPDGISRVSRRGKTPFVAIFIIATAAVVFALVGKIGTVADMINASVLLAFTAVNVALIRIRLRGDNMPGAFRTPFTIQRIPLIPFFGAAISLFMLVYTGVQAIVFLAVIVALGIGLDMVLSHRQSADNPTPSPRRETSL